MVRDCCFSVLYGLPAAVSHSIGGRAVLGYLPIFRIRWPDAEEMATYARCVAFAAGDATGSEADVGERPAVGSPVSRTEGAFLGAVDNLAKVLGSPAKPPGPLAAAIEWVVWCCIHQRQLNVWAADDPAAAAMADEHWDLVEKVLGVRMVRGSGLALAERQTLEARLLAMDEFLKGRREDANVAAKAVEWREWGVVAGWLSDACGHYPSIDEDGLQQTLAAWKASACTWENMPQG